MAVLKRHVAPGMTQEAYDQASGHVQQSQKEADGFVAHYAVFENGGLTVTEVWDSVEQHDAWWDAHMRGVVPADLPRPEFAEIHRINSK